MTIPENIYDNPELALSSADQFAIAIEEWEACPYPERAAYLAGLSDEARAAVSACVRLDGLTVREELEVIGEQARAVTQDAA
jgi:hypothetical protein